MAVAAVLAELAVTASHDFCTLRRNFFLLIIGQRVDSKGINKPDKLVVVVHGVGDPPPGETLSLFARSIAEQDKPLLESNQTLWLEEKSKDFDYIQTFPAHRRTIERSGETIEMVETFWGDLSQVGRGIFGIIHGMFQIIFGLRYVAYVAADQPGLAARWLKTLGLMSSRILHGPVLAVTCFLGLLITSVCGTHIVWPESHRFRIWTTIVILGCGAFAFFASEIGTRLTRSRVVERFWFWVNVTVAFVTGVMLFRLFWLDDHYPAIAHSCDIHPGLMWYCRVLLVLLGMLWFIEIQVIVAMGVCWFFAIRHKKAFVPALHVAFLLPALAVGIWAQAIPMSWIAAKESIASLSDLQDFSRVFDDAIPFLGVQFAMLAVLLLATCIVVARYAIWRGRNPLDSYQKGGRSPRLIVNNAVQSSLGICTVLGLLLVSSLWISNTFASESSVGDQATSQSYLGEILAQANGYAIAAVVPLGGLMFFALPHLRPGFDIVLDVVNHFYFRPTNVEDVLDDDDEFDIVETTFQNGTLFFSRRDALHGRLRRILTHYRDQYDHMPELIVVAHSQGTMVAIETLNDHDLLWLKNAFSRVTLVTMGSPFHHVYQHYFGHYYPSIDQPYWASLRRRVDHWVNIFRVDDYVGTEIAFPQTSSSVELGKDEMLEFESATENIDGKDAFLKAADTGTQPDHSSIEFENHVVGARGHVNYWTDRDVLEILRNRVFDVDAGQELRRAA